MSLRYSCHFLQVSLLSLFFGGPCSSLLFHHFKARLHCSEMYWKWSQSYNFPCWWFEFQIQWDLVHLFLHVCLNPHVWWSHRFLNVQCTKPPCDSNSLSSCLFPVAAIILSLRVSGSFFLINGFLHTCQTSRVQKFLNFVAGSMWECTWKILIQCKSHNQI